MKHFNLVPLTFISFVLLFFSCRKLHEDENHHYKIYFENHWEKSIFIWYSIDWHWYYNPYEKHFTLFAEEPLYENESFHLIQPGGVDDELMEHRGYYETALESGDSVVISVFDAEQPNKNDSEVFLVRYHLSKADLKKVGFHVSYPPTESMRNIYMKPSFNEINK